MNQLAFFACVLRASLLSTSGMGNVATLHQDFVIGGHVTESQFAEALAVGQISPGPNGLWVVSLGYIMNGIAGASLALLAVMLPPFIVLLISRMYGHVESHPLVNGFIRFLTLSVVGIFLSAMLGMLNSVGIDARSISIAVASFLAARFSKLPILAIVGIGAVLGIVMTR